MAKREAVDPRQRRFGAGCAAAKQLFPSGLAGRLAECSSSSRSSIEALSDEAQFVETSSTETSSTEVSSQRSSEESSDEVSSRVSVFAFIKLTVGVRSLEGVELELELLDKLHVDLELLLEGLDFTDMTLPL